MIWGLKLHYLIKENSKYSLCLIYSNYCSFIKLWVICSMHVFPLASYENGLLMLMNMWEGLPIMFVKAYWEKFGCGCSLGWKVKFLKMRYSFKLWHNLPKKAEGLFGSVVGSQESKCLWTMSAGDKFIGAPGPVFLGLLGSVWFSLKPQLTFDSLCTAF